MKQKPPAIAGDRQPGVKMTSDKPSYYWQFLMKLKTAAGGKEPGLDVRGVGARGGIVFWGRVIYLI